MPHVSTKEHIMIVRCHCGADPAGRWKKPAALIFINRMVEDKEGNARPEYRCREHVSAKREQEIQAAERSRGFPLR
jgi:hypothetical protein